MGSQPSFPYELKRSARRRTLAICVFRDGRVEVRAPVRCPAAYIERFVQERAAWVAKQREKLALLPAAAAPGYGEGAPVPCMGETLRLRLTTGKRQAWREAGELWVSLREPCEQQARELVLRWYRAEAERCLSARLRGWWEALPWLAAGRTLPTLKLGVMKRQWGSCSSRGDIRLNVLLMREAPELIDYVIVHELCHLLEMNHGPRFQAHMDRAMPDWRLRRHRLNQSSSPAC